MCMYTQHAVHDGKERLERHHRALKKRNGGRVLPEDEHDLDENNKKKEREEGRNLCVDEDSVE